MRATKDEFYQELENVINSIPVNEMYVILGDLNAHVGSRASGSDQLEEIRGPHGCDVINDHDARKELLSFLSFHQATICNTWYQKKDIYKQMWQHPKLKQWSCIDHIIMHQKDRRVCLDVADIQLL